MIRVKTGSSRYSRGSGKGKIRTCIFLLLLALVLPAAADISPKSQNMYEKYVIERCYSIQNTGEYPGYIFGIAPWPDQNGGFVSLDDKRCFEVNNYTHQSQIYAMREIDYSRLKTKNPLLVPSSAAIPSGYPAPLQAFGIKFSHEADNLTDTLAIVSLNDAGLHLRTTRSSYMFRNGYIEEDSQKTEPTFPVIPPPSPTTPTATLPPHVIIASIFITFGMALFLRVKKQS